jgi:hypothetical protein
MTRARTVNFLATLVLLVVTATGCLCGRGGRVCSVAIADSSWFQPWSTSSGLVSWIQQHYSRMLVYAPWFDAAVSWYPNGWFYKDTYAVPVGSSLGTQHPDWILRDASGTPLYVPFACTGSGCPQYAGDVGNPDFRDHWLAEASATMAAGYRGIFLDDFNMRLQIGDGTGRLVTPMNPRTRAPMTDDEWRGYMADFATEIRTVFPSAELVQNQVYFFAPASDPNVVRATQHADYVWIERGFNDPGLVGGTGPFGFETLLAYVDAVHAAGAGTVVQVQGAADTEYALACYFLASTGFDGLANSNTESPSNWSSANDVDLGDPVSPVGHYRWNGLFRRDFAAGMTLVNQPGSPTTTVALGGTYRRLDGTVVTSVTLAAATGAVLIAQ